METTSVAIVGASGYTGEELVHWLSRHPRVRLTAVTSRQFKGKLLSDALGASSTLAGLAFEDLSPAEIAQRAEVIFLALPHGVAAEFAVPLRQAGRIVIDLSADFRLRSPAIYREFYGHEHPAPNLLTEAVYANPTLHRAAIRTSDLLAAPGCYPTSILLGLAPALKARWIEAKSIVINSMSGASGAGKKAELPLLYGEINENVRAYGVAQHRHLSEIEQEIALMGGGTEPVTFIPHLAPLTRGMFTTITATLASGTTAAAVQEAYEEFYRVEPFVRVLRGEALPEVKRVARTNNCELAVRLDSRTGRLMIFSVIDNLVRGAGGQAIQAMNVRLGFDEEEGLQA